MDNKDREYQFRNFTLWIYVTNKCNRACSYCKQGTPIEYSDSMSRESLEYIFDECVKAHEKGIVNHFDIVLSGGEPFLEFDIFSDIMVRYGKKYPKLLNFRITTNGTIVNEKILEWLRYNCRRIAVSIDSLRYSKPINSISSSELQIKNIELLNKVGVRVAGLSVFYSQTVDEMLELADYAVKNLFGWRILLCKPTIHTKDQILAVVKPVIKYLYDHDYHQYFDFDGWSLWDEARGGRGGRNTCICGRTLLSVTPDLETHPNNEAPFIKLGKFTYDIQSLIDHPNNIYFKNDWRPLMCDGCDLRKDCDGGCRLCHKDPTMLKEKCDAIRELLQYVKLLGRIINNHNRQVGVRESFNSEAVRMTCTCANKTDRRFSPWVFVTYGCSCKCEYCMVPKMTGKKTMSKATFEEMLKISSRILEAGEVDSFHFRMSGGEPMLVFENFKDLVPKYKKEYPGRISFGILTNLVRFDEEIANWMAENDIGMQVSLDDLENSKPLQNGQSSSNIVLKNIQLAQARGINFSINTVLDVEKTKSLVGMANFVSSLNGIEWGLNASYTEKDGSKCDKVIKTFDECISHLVKRGFDVNRRLRFYNIVVGTGRGGCSAGINSCAIGTGLEIWPCQSLCDGKPIGVFDENVLNTLTTAEGNSYFKDRRMMSSCSECEILGYCRGGCRATHESDETNDVVCRIRRDIIGKLASGYYTQGYNNHQCHYGRNFNCGVDHDHGAQIQKMLEDYIHENPNMETVETPEIS